jgi:glycosyltransferase involved in cell wall biosynthesis
LNEVEADAIHAHNDSALVYSAWALSPMARRPRLIATYHNLSAHDTWASRWLARRAARRADAVVCVSNDLAQRLRRSGWLERASVIGNGVDLRRFAPRSAGGTWRARWNVHPQALLIGCVARLAPSKRHKDLIDAAKSANARGLRTHLVFIGEGPERASLEARARGAVELSFVGFERDVAGILAELDVVTLVSEHEGLPMSLLEAMACGRPVLATNVGGIPELLDGGERSGGLLVESGDIEGMSAGMVRLADPELRREWGERARARAVSTHDLTQVAASYRALYVGKDSSA